MLPERAYVLGVLFDTWAGVPITIIPEDRTTTEIRLSGDTSGEGAALVMPDVFLASDPDQNSVLESALQRATDSTMHFDAEEIAGTTRVIDRRVPVLFGVDPTSLIVQGGGSLKLPIDIIGSAFFMLTRHEEVSNPASDHHGRFPARASLAYRAGILDRPIVDEYFELLWASLRRLWPRLEPLERQARTFVSCDLDHPFLTEGGPRAAVRQVARDVVRHHALGRGLATTRDWLRSAIKASDADRYRRTIDWMMDINEAMGHRVTFNVLPTKTHPTRDLAPSLDQPRMRRLLRAIHDRGHEIGIHPGYGTFIDAGAFTRSVQSLRRVLALEQIDQGGLGGRQHYLRWRTPLTARLWEQHDLTYDSTLGYAEYAGFRCGTCKEYPLFDVEARRSLNLRERPLVAMEASVLSPVYENTRHPDEAFRRIQHLQDACARVDGDFTLLWHNSYLETSSERRLYARLLSSAAAA